MITKLYYAENSIRYRWSKLFEKFQNLNVQPSRNLYLPELVDVDIVWSGNPIPIISNSYFHNWRELEIEQNNSLHEMDRRHCQRRVKIVRDLETFSLVDLADSGDSC